MSSRLVSKSSGVDCKNDQTISARRHGATPTHSKNMLESYGKEKSPTKRTSLRNTRGYETFLNRWPPASPSWLMRWTERSVQQRALPRRRQNRFSSAKLPRSLVGFKVEHTNGSKKLELM